MEKTFVEKLLTGDMTAAAATLAAVFVGFGLSIIPTWYVRKRRVAARWGALRVEVETCAEDAAECVDRAPPAPLWRLPVIVYREAVPGLLADGAITAAEVKTLMRFYDVAEQLNRGLDLEAHFAVDKKEEDRVEESERNYTKAYRLLDRERRKNKPYPMIDVRDRKVLAGERYDPVDEILRKHKV